MHKSQKPLSSQIPLVDYIPAELRELKNGTWRIVYYARIPGSTKMRLFKRRVRPMSNKKERRRYGKRMCAELNNKLHNGWSPFHEESSSSEYVTLKEALERFNTQNEKLYNGDQLRQASLKSYQSMANRLLTYIKEIDKEKMFCIEFNRSFVVNYKDYIYFKKKRTATTVNNYINFCQVLANYLVDRGYIKNNTITGIPLMKAEKKKREVIDQNSRKKIFRYYKENNQSYLTLCLMVFYCFIRRTELTRLKICDIQFDKGIIVLPARLSKNRKTQSVTIPKKLLERLENHISGYSSELYVFSNNNFKPGESTLKPKKISDTWRKMRAELALPDSYQFYSLKDSGITELFLMNVPLIKIRDQARHQDIRMTEKYTPRSYEKDQTISSIDFEF